MNINRLDHLVLTVLDVPRTCEFYRKVLNFEVREADGRVALHFGRTKINLHQQGHEFEPKANKPTPGAGDLCFITDETMENLLNHLKRSGVAVVEGPVEQTGALGPMTSVYFRDPDLNLIEVSRYARL